MIAKETINQVLERASLVELVSETVKLKRLGSSYVGLCPFHAEKSGSFNIRQDKFFHCFGCGVSGNVIGYYMRQSGLSFPEAVEQLANRLGIPVVRDVPSKFQEDFSIKDKLFDLNETAFKFFAENLRNAPRAVIDYLKSRGLSKEAVREFRVGFAPAQGLVAHLKAQGISDDMLVKAGLARRNPRGDLYDYFRDRIIFPIFVDNRRIAGFGGRIIPELLREESKNKAPKYLNSLETPVYEKSKILYGLPIALQNLKGARSLYIVEGYLDVISLWMAGVRNAVATCGTAVTEQHIKRMKTAVSRVDFMFDGDAAGRRGAGKSFPLFINSGLEVSCLFLPEGEDPDTFSLKHADQTAKLLLDLEKKPLFDCYIEELCQQQGVQRVQELGAAGKGKVAKIVAEPLSLVSNPVEKAELQERLSLLLKVQVESISSLLSESEKSAAKDRTSQSPPTGQVERTREVEALPAFDRELLRSVMGLKGSLAEGILDDQELCGLLQVETLSFLTELGEIQRRAALNKAEVLKVLRGFGDSWVKFWIESSKLAEEVDMLDVFEKLKLRARRMRLDEQVEYLRMALNEVSDPAEQTSIAQRKLELERQRDNLR